MKKTREQRQTELQAKANEMIQRLLDWTEQTDKPNLTQMEDEIIALREEMSLSMLESILSAQDASQPVEVGKCDKCGRPLRYKGRRKGQVVSRIGGTGVERGYYYCAECQTGIFPPGSTTGIE